jgi:hypothetical protein
MLQHVESHPALDVRDREPGSWPIVIALAVIGPLALAVALAVLVAVAG